MSEQFETFISQLSETNATLDYFTDFGKIKTNLSKISIKALKDYTAQKKA